MLRTAIMISSLSSLAFAGVSSAPSFWLLTFGTEEPVQISLLMSFFILAGALIYWIGNSILTLYRSTGRRRPRVKFKPAAQGASSWERSAKARNDIYQALNLGDQGKTLTFRSKSIELDSRTKREAFLVLGPVKEGDKRTEAFEVECRITGTLAPWTRLREDQIRAGKIYLKFVGKKFFLFRADEQGFLSEMLGQVQQGSVVSGHVLGLGHRGESFQLAADGHWYRCEAPESLHISFVSNLSLAT